MEHETEIFIKRQCILLIEFLGMFIFMHLRLARQVFRRLIPSNRAKLSLTDSRLIHIYGKRTQEIVGVKIQCKVISKAALCAGCDKKNLVLRENGQCRRLGSCGTK